MKQIEGNLLDIPDGLLAHVVNDRHIMGGGIALQIRNKWPHVAKQYRTSTAMHGACQVIFVGLGEHRLAVCNLFAQRGLRAKDHPIGRRYLHYGDLALALGDLRAEAQFYKLDVFVPFLMGCGLAGGNWEVVLELLDTFVPTATIVKYDYELPLRS